MKKILLYLLNVKFFGLVRLIAGVARRPLVAAGVSIALLGEALRDIAVRLQGPLPAGWTPDRVDVAEGGAEVATGILEYLKLLHAGTLSPAQASENSDIIEKIGVLLLEVADRFDAQTVPAAA